MIFSRQTDYSQRILIVSIILGIMMGASPLTTNGSAKESTMQMRTELPKTNFIASEAMLLTITIINGGNSAVHIPDPEANLNRQPTYTLRGPQYPDGHSFSFGSATAEKLNNAPAPQDPMLISLAAGQTHVAQVPLEQLAAIHIPGTYSLYADIDWQAVKIQSREITFTVERPQISDCQLVTAPGLQDASLMRMFCLHQTQTNRGAIYLASFSYHEQMGKIVLTSLDPFADTDGPASAIFGPWMNFPIGPPSPRAGWQNGNTLSVKDFGDADAMSITLPWRPTIIQPAVSPDSGDMDLFVLNPAAPEIGLVRFPHPIQSKVQRRIGQPAPPPPKVPQAELLWTLPVPPQPIGGCAYIAPKRQKDASLLLLLSQNHAGAEVHLIKADAAEKPDHLRSMNFEGLFAVKNTKPTLRIRPDGQIDAAVLLSTHPDGNGLNKIVRVDIHWPAPENAPGHFQTVDLCEVPSEPQATAAAFPLTAGQSRCDWAVLKADGRLLTANPRPLDEYKPNGEVMIPLEMLSLTDRSYLLTIGKQGTIGFE